MAESWISSHPDPGARFNHLTAQVAGALVEQATGSLDIRPRRGPVKAVIMRYPRPPGPEEEELPGIEDKPRVSVDPRGFVYFNKAALDRLRSIAEESGPDSQPSSRGLRGILGGRTGPLSPADKAVTDTILGLVTENPNLVELVVSTSTKDPSLRPGPRPGDLDGLTMAVAGAVPVGLEPAQEAELAQLLAAARAEGPAALHQGILRLQELADGPPTSNGDPLVRTADSFTRDLASRTKRSQAEVVDALSQVPPDQTLDVAAALVFEARTDGAQVDDVTRADAVRWGVDAMRDGSTTLQVLALLRRNELMPIADSHPYLGQVRPNSLSGLRGETLLADGEDGMFGSLPRELTKKDRFGRPVVVADQPIDLDEVARLALEGSADARGATTPSPTGEASGQPSSGATTKHSDPKLGITPNGP